MRGRDRLARRAAQQLGYHLVRANHYSPIPDLDAVPDAAWDEAPMPGVDLRLDATFLEDDLAAFIAEYDVRTSAHGYEPGNPMYPPADALLLYAMLRHLRPERVLEVGAGWSTRVVRDALARNESECEHLAYDPDPAAAGRAGEGAPLRRAGAHDIPDEAFARLTAGDVLFVDTTHTLKPGSDVLRLLLEVLPTIAPGVVVHVHDFYRPFEYPRALMERFGVYWQEHYLLQAFLAFNDAFEVLIANHALGRLRPERARAVLGPDAGAGSALWLRRR